MDRRSWLWRRKSSSEKAAGIIAIATAATTESSGSLSSHSERFSDDQELLKPWTTNVDVPFKLPAAAPDGGGGSVDTAAPVTVEELAKQLSAALATVTAKEQLLKQHAKVTEEAVSGWEKAELEVATMKKQLDMAVQMSSSRDNRINQLEEALRECVEQLRKAREEQEERIHETLAQKNRDWDAQKVNLEMQIAELEARLEVEREEHFSDNYEFEQRLEMMEKENSELWMEIVALSEKLRIEAFERELSVQAAETASKQHLESIKKTAKLEAECQRLCISSRKSQANTDARCHNDIVAADISMNGPLAKTEQIPPMVNEPNHMNSWASALISQLEQFKIVKETNPGAYGSSMEFDIDDFLEIEEKLAAAATADDHHCTSQFNEQLGSSNLCDTRACPSKSELEQAHCRILAMEENIKKIQSEKRGIEILLSENQEMLQKSSTRIKQAEIQLMKMASQLDHAHASKEDSDKVVKQLEALGKTMESELQHVTSEAEKLQEKLLLLEGRVNEESTLARQFKHKCLVLEKELSRKRKTNSVKVDAAYELLKSKLDKGFAAAGSVKFTECQKTITSISRQLRSLTSLEDFMLEAESQSSIALTALHTGEAKKMTHVKSLHPVNTITMSIPVIEEIPKG